MSCRTASKSGTGRIEQADVENHVDVVRAVFNNAGGFVALGAGEGGTQGKADDAPTGIPVPGERRRRGDPGGVDHGAGEPVLGRLVAELEDLVAGGVGLEEGVVEDCGEVLGGRESMGGEGCGVEVFRSVGEGIGDGQRSSKACSCGEGRESPRYFLSYRDKGWLKAMPPPCHMLRKVFIPFMVEVGLSC